MPEIIDPYHRWLGIRPEHQPPNHYRLLGLELFEADVEVIRDGAARQTNHVRKYALGEYRDFSQRLLNEIGAARACLADQQRKSAYDDQLRCELPPSDPQRAIVSNGTPSAATPELDQPAATNGARDPALEPIVATEGIAAHAHTAVAQPAPSMLPKWMLGSVLAIAGSAVLLAGGAIWYAATRQPTTIIFKSEPDSDAVAGPETIGKGEEAPAKEDPPEVTKNESPVVEKGEPKKPIFRLRSMPDQSVNPGDRLSLEVKVDPQLAGKMTMELVGAPKGVSIEERSGKLSWTPSLNDFGNKYVFSVVLRDEGGKRLDQKKLTVNVREYEPFKDIPTAVGLPPDGNVDIGLLWLLPNLGCELRLFHFQAVEREGPFVLGEPAHGRQETMWAVKHLSKDVADFFIRDGMLIFAWRTNPSDELLQLQNGILRVTIAGRQQDVALRQSAQRAALDFKQLQKNDECVHKLAVPVSPPADRMMFEPTALHIPPAGLVGNWLPVRFPLAALAKAPCSVDIDLNKFWPAPGPIVAPPIKKGAGAAAGEQFNPAGQNPAPNEFGQQLDEQTLLHLKMKQQATDEAKAETQAKLEIRADVEAGVPRFSMVVKYSVPSPSGPKESKKSWSKLQLGGKDGIDTEVKLCEDKFQAMLREYVVKVAESQSLRVQIKRVENLIPKNAGEIQKKQTDWTNLRRKERQLPDQIISLEQRLRVMFKRKAGLEAIQRLAKALVSDGALYCRLLLPADVSESLDLVLLDSPAPEIAAPAVVNGGDAPDIEEHESDGLDDSQGPADDEQPLPHGPFPQGLDGTGDVDGRPDQFGDPRIQPANPARNPNREPLRIEVKAPPESARPGDELSIEYQVHGTVERAPMRLFHRIERLGQVGQFRQIAPLARNRMIQVIDGKYQIEVLPPPADRLAEMQKATIDTRQFPRGKYRLTILVSHDGTDATKSVDFTLD